MFRSRGNGSRHRAFAPPGIEPGIPLFPRVSSSIMILGRTSRECPDPNNRDRLPPGHCCPGRQARRPGRAEFRSLLVSRATVSPLISFHSQRMVYAAFRSGGSQLRDVDLLHHLKLFLARAGIPDVMLGLHLLPA